MSETRFSRKPEWLKVRAPGGDSYRSLKELLRGLTLHTVCEEAHCPNVGECWGGGTATVMLLGDVCTRGCRFCAVKTGNPRGVLDRDEPRKVAEALERLGLKYVVLTSVDRDDLHDGGAGHFAQTIREIKARTPEMIVEVLIPDFRADFEALRTIVGAAPDVVAHNVETVERLTPGVRDRRAPYGQSLEVLRRLKALNPETYTKSSVMLGLGETREEIVRTLHDLRTVGVDVLTLGQYLRPTEKHLPVVEYVTPAQFDEYRLIGESMGFMYVASGPLVRSSYRAGEFFMEGLVRKRRTQAAG
ncbi:MAG: lipoyl synthase [Armatimonadetes bacterium]|nr:lipoyl synthase [Armatimonadota bacterium]